MTEHDYLVKEQALMVEISRGERAKVVLSSACWKTDVEPYLERRASELTRGSSWKPGSNIFSVDAVALGAAYNGGREEECFNLSNILNIWVEQGKVAHDKLVKLQKEHKK